MTALAWLAGFVLIVLMAASLAATLRATTDQQAKRDRDELRRRESLRTVLDAHTAPLVARSASNGRLTGMAYKGTAEERRAALISQEMRDEFAAEYERRCARPPRWSPETLGLDDAQRQVKDGPLPLPLDVRRPRYDYIEQPGRGAHTAPRRRLLSALLSARPWRWS